MNINQVLEATLKDNGGTFRKNDDEDSWEQVVMPEFGYFVSSPRGIENLPKLRVETLGDFVESRIRVMLGITFLGIWNEEYGNAELANWSIDESVWVENRETAMSIGRLHNQKAIYDCAEDRNIWL